MLSVEYTRALFIVNKIVRNSDSSRQKSSTSGLQPSDSDVDLREWKKENTYDIINHTKSLVTRRSYYTQYPVKNVSFASSFVAIVWFRDLVSTVNEVKNSPDEETFFFMLS